MQTGSRSTRRQFLLGLAGAAAFVPPAMASVDLRPLAAQGKGSTSSGSGGKGAGAAVGQSTVGSLSPTAQSVSTPQFQLDQQTSPAPWSQRPGEPPPWSRRPPTQTGR